MISRLAMMVVTGLAVGVGVAPIAPPTDTTLEERIKNATTEKQGEYHVVFRETVTGKTPADWKGTYNAQITLKVPGAAELQTYLGSTLPSSDPPVGVPADFRYSVVLSNGAFPLALRNRLYRWTKTERAKSKAPCLRLATEVPTVFIAPGSQQVIATLSQGLQNADSMRFATAILIHTGGSGNRASEGCLTVDPKDADRFFGQIPMGATGTLLIARGLQDAKTGTSQDF